MGTEKISTPTVIIKTEDQIRATVCPITSFLSGKCFKINKYYLTEYFKIITRLF